MPQRDLDTATTKASQRMGSSDALDREQESLQKRLSKLRELIELGFKPGPT